MTPLSLRPALAGLLCVAGLASCRQDAAKPAPPPPTVVVAPVARQDVNLYIEAVGTLDGYVNAEIRARVRGLLQAQRYKDGAPSSRGSCCSSIDRSEYAAGARRGQGRRSRAPRPPPRTTRPSSSGARTSAPRAS